MKNGLMKSMALLMLAAPVMAGQTVSSRLDGASSASSAAASAASADGSRRLSQTALEGGPSFESTPVDATGASGYGLSQKPSLTAAPVHAAAVEVPAPYHASSGDDGQRAAKFLIIGGLAAPVVGAIAGALLGGGLGAGIGVLIGAAVGLVLLAAGVARALRHIWPG